MNHPVVEAAMKKPTYTTGDRLRDIIDECFGMQPVMSDEDALTFLERRLFEQRTGNRHYAMANGAAVRPYITIADCDRATAWLDHEWPEEHPGTRAQQALSTLLAEVRRETIEACIALVKSIPQCTWRCGNRLTDEMAALFTSTTEEKKP